MPAEAAAVDTAPACLLCRSRATSRWARATDVEYRTTDDTFSYYQCRDCGVLFIDPVPAARLPEIYPSTYYAFDRRRRSLIETVKERLDRRQYRRILRNVPGTALRVLDVGGGSGWQLDVVRAAEPRVTYTAVVDPNADAVAEARRHDHAGFCGRVEDFPTGARFDLTLMLNVIEHVADPGAVLGKLRDLLTPDGVAVVQTPNYDSLDARLFRHASWAGYHCPRHWVLFTQASFEALARRSGLAVRNLTYTQGASFWSASLLAALARRGMVAITPERPVVYHPAFPPLSAAFAGIDLARRPFAKTSQMIALLGRKR